MLDCIIVGAGPAGATAAYHLAKKGYSVLLLDKAQLPRDKPCGGGVSPAVQKWFDFDFTPVIDNRVNKVQFTWKSGDPVTTKLNTKESMWMVKRDKFDDFLCQQAQKQGAKLQDKTQVTGIQYRGDYWQVNTSNGNLETRYLIAADGVNSQVAKWLGLGTTKDFLGATLEVKTSLPPDRQNLAYFDFGSLKNGYIWMFPKSDGYSISGACFKGSIKSDELKKGLFNYASRLGLNTGDATYSEHPLGLWTENLGLHANHALIAGDAAALLDPLIGEGIRPAILTGVKAAEAIDAALKGNAEALPAYTETIKQEWGNDMALAQKLSGLFYQLTQIAYKVGVKRPSAGQLMGRILCGELRYSDVTEQIMNRLKKLLIPGFGR
ncbi:MAG: Flavin-dependent monooxygenase [Chroococcopsis gigantea SAG 12.99]|jgi:geranylgeranyl reductase family protein|nr:geranylgeranyl reductase family protein [Chlorogloea purpurea SAG 13.99]MDV3002218.1 Flavin-dependent monooxygenase [Chroococcopsis gigantea SAG 12.99]